MSKPLKKGRPFYVPTEKDRSFVRAMIMAGVQQRRIAQVMQIDPKTLRKHFRTEIDFGEDQANATVVANLYRQATKDDFKAIPAAIFWSKTRLGWREKNEIDLSSGMVIQIGKEFDDL